jgi:hypothetical protein
VPRSFHGTDPGHPTIPPRKLSAEDPAEHPVREDEVDAERSTVDLVPQPAMTAIPAEPAKAMTRAKSIRSPREERELPG